LENPWAGYEVPSHWPPAPPGWVEEFSGTLAPEETAEETVLTCEDPPEPSVTDGDEFTDPFEDIEDIMREHASRSPSPPPLPQPDLETITEEPEADFIAHGPHGKISLLALPQNYYGPPPTWVPRWAGRKDYSGYKIFVGDLTRDTDENVIGRWLLETMTSIWDIEAYNKVIDINVTAPSCRSTSGNYKAF